MDDFEKLTITGVRRETPDAISMTLAVPPDLAGAFRHQPGQYVALRVLIDGQEVQRTYSLCCGPEDADLRIAVKRVPGGVFSSWADATLQAGQTIEVMPPMGRFVLPPGDGRPRHLLAFAAGAGITPVIAIVKHALAQEPATRVTLFYGNRGPETILFREELEDLKDRHLGRFWLAHVLSRAAAGQSALLEGRIDGAKVTTIARKLVDLGEVDHAFLCGPGGMIKEARNALMAEGLARERIHYEFFAPGGGAYRKPPEPPPDATPQVGGAEAVAIIDGVRHRFAVPAGERVLDAALKAGVRLPYSCKGGMCCTCRCKLRAGEVAMDVNYSLEPWELEAGYVLACQSRPLTPHIELDFDAT